MHIGHEIHLLQFNPLGLLEQLPAHKHDEHDGQFNIEADKADSVECRAEAGPALHENKKTVEKNRQPWSVGVCPVFEWEEVRFVLSLETGAESDGCDADCDPAELVGNTD